MRITTHQRVAGFVFSGIAFYTYHYRIPVTNPVLKQIIRSTDNSLPIVSKKLLTFLFKYSAIRECSAFNDYILDSSFDSYGFTIEGVCNAGFKGMIVGPSSFLPTHPQEKEKRYEGIYLISKILQFRNGAVKRKDDFTLGLHIAPNDEVVKFAPYLLRENVINMINDLLDYARLYTKPTVQFVIVDFNQENFKILAEKTSIELEHMLIDIIEETHTKFKESKFPIDLVVKLNPNFKTVLDHILKNPHLASKITLEEKTYRVEQKVKWLNSSADLKEDTQKTVSWKEMIEWIAYPQGTPLE